jgi:sulfatase maturation enzyme AslB (radical SAM superfamily)
VAVSDVREVIEAPALIDPLLRRLGAAARRDDVRTQVAAALASGGAVLVRARLVDADTDVEELVELARELGRYALRWPGRVEIAHTGGDLPADPWAHAALDAGWLRLDGPPTGLLPRLRAGLLALHEATPRGLIGERALRVLDDATRRLVFELLRDAWRERAGGWGAEPMPKDEALRLAIRHLGEEGRWIKAFRQYSFDDFRRMVLIPTWQCELRCAYCFIPKQDGRVMSMETIDRSVELLLSTEEPDVELQFFGGEALLEYERVQRAILRGRERAAALGKRIRFIVSSNGWSLTPERLAWLRDHDARLELSLDGTARTHNRFRPSRHRGESSYDHSPAACAQEILASGIEQWVIMVVHPTNVDAMPESFFHIADLGFRRIQINNMLGRVWTTAQMESFGRGLFAIGQEMIRRAAAGQAVELINMNHSPLAMRLNGEVTVDHDGTIYGGNQFLHETEHKQLFVVGHLDQLTNVDRYLIEFTDNNFLLEWGYRPHVTENNVGVGRIMASFIKWMKGRGFDSAGRASVSPEAAAPRR